MAATIVERDLEIDGIRIHLREVEGAGRPTLLLHGNPTNSADWIPFLEVIDGPAIAPDLPGFGRSGRPAPGSFDYSMGAYGRLLAELLGALAPDGYRLVVHDWGVLGLLAARTRPEAVRRLVVIDAVPFSAAYRWHWVARCWRRRGLGEAFSRPRSRWVTDRLLRLARDGRRPMPPGFIDMVLEHWDEGTSRAILALYRSADPDVLAAAGERLGEIRCPALVVWGDSDPYISPADGRFYERALPGASFREVDRAGHWPWIDRPDLVGEIVSFLAADGEVGGLPVPGSSPTID